MYCTSTLHIPASAHDHRQREQQRDEENLAVDAKGASQAGKNNGQRGHENVLSPKQRQAGQLEKSCPVGLILM